MRSPSVRPIAPAVALLAASLSAILAAGARAQDPGDPEKAVSEAIEGLPPIADTSSGFWTRERLAGDLWGKRTEWARKGIQFDITFTQSVQSVVDGGIDTGTRYGGTLDYDLELDLQRMGVLDGAILRFRAE